jgi:hypothetical protein
MNVFELMNLHYFFPSLKFMSISFHIIPGGCSGESQQGRYSTRVSKKSRIAPEKGITSMWAPGSSAPHPTRIPFRAHVLRNSAEAADSHKTGAMWRQDASLASTTLRPCGVQSGYDVVPRTEEKRVPFGKSSGKQEV